MRDFSKGRICAKVWLRPPPSEPLIDACMALDCTTRIHVLQTQCPFHTGGEYVDGFFFIILIQPISPLLLVLLSFPPPPSAFLFNSSPSYSPLHFFFSILLDASIYHLVRASFSCLKLLFFFFFIILFFFLRLFLLFIIFSFLFFFFHSPVIFLAPSYLFFLLQVYCCFSPASFSSSPSSYT